MENTTYIDRIGLWVAVFDDLFYIDDDESPGPVTLTPGEAREIRDTITHWLDNRKED